jgi:hypothetical protein
MVQNSRIRLYSKILLDAYCTSFISKQLNNNKMNETLKRDLASRMFDGVKIDISYYDETEPKTMSYLDDEESVYVRINNKAGQYVHDLLQSYDLEHIKPYLFPTSALTKPIQLANYNNGEPFVPIEELWKIFYENEEDSIESEVVYDMRYLNMQVNGAMGCHIPFSIMEYFNQWHINYRLSTDQFIEVTNENNPYK